MKLRVYSFVVVTTALLLGCHGKTSTKDTEYGLDELWPYSAEDAANEPAPPDSIWATEWMQLYGRYVVEHNLTVEHGQWGLAYIDGDEVPELLLRCWSEATGCRILSAFDGKVTEWQSWRCGNEFVPLGGLVRNCDGSMGNYWDRIVRLKDGRFTEIFNHTDRLHRSHDKINDTTGADEYWCFFDGDSTMRIGFDDDCHHYDKRRDVLYPQKRSIPVDSVAKYPISLLLHYDRQWKQSADVRYLRYFYEDSTSKVRADDTLFIYAGNGRAKNHKTRMFGQPLKYVTDDDIDNMNGHGRSFAVHDLNYTYHPYSKVLHSSEYIYAKEVDLWIYEYSGGETQGGSHSFCYLPTVDSTLDAWK